MRIISFTTILGGVALTLSYLFKNISVKKNEERIRQTLEKTQIGLTKEQIEGLVKRTTEANITSSKEELNLSR